MSLGGIVARNIRRLRLERGLTQEALAVDAGIDRTYVSRLETWTGESNSRGSRKTGPRPLFEYRGVI
jgi:predicted transcriptional regulator